MRAPHATAPADDTSSPLTGACLPRCYRATVRRHGSFGALRKVEKDCGFPHSVSKTWLSQPPTRSSRYDASTKEQRKQTRYPKGYGKVKGRKIATTGTG